MRVLIADDARVMRSMLARTLATLGHAVIGEAATLERAQTVALEEQPDVIAVDGRLGGAVDVAALVRSLQPAAPAAAIFVIVSLDEMPLVKRAVAAGARGAIRRPIVASQLREALAVARDEA